MKTIEQIRLQPRLCIIQESSDGLMAWAELRATVKPQRVALIVSWGGGWDHVSASFRNRTPTWEEMAEIKEMFFRKEETAVQFHPAAAEYINQHPYCLHIWKKQGQQHELPPWWMIGMKKGGTWTDVMEAVEKETKQLQSGA